MPKITSINGAITHTPPPFGSLPLACTTQTSRDIATQRAAGVQTRSSGTTTSSPVPRLQVLLPGGA